MDAKEQGIPYYYAEGGQNIIPYGLENDYPNRILNAIRKSPTARGCVKRVADFVFGKGLKNGDIIVNRNNQTLNDVILQSITNNYVPLGGLAFHFNFNVFGEIVEISAVDLINLRRIRDKKALQLGVWNTFRTNHFQSKFYEIDLYDNANSIQYDNEYRGQIMYIVKDGSIYPTSPLDGATLSASFEKESQTYQLANVKNGFSATSIIKIPTIPQAEVYDDNDEINDSPIGSLSGERKEQKDNYEIDGGSQSVADELKKLHGAEHAGGKIVIPLAVDLEGKVSDTKLVETLMPPDVDKLFVNQNNHAENSILKTFTMPSVLLGIVNKGLFNSQSFNDAFNYKNADTEMDRMYISRKLREILEKSIFSDSAGDEIEPLEMKNLQQKTVFDDKK